MLAGRKPLTGSGQTIVVLLALTLVLAMAWITQYTMTKALQRPRPASETLPR
jgi:hypothetical protein